MISLHKLFMNLITPIQLGFGGGDGGASEEKRLQEEKEERIRQGTDAVNALFGTDGRKQQYADHRQNVYDLNKGALDESYGDAKRNLMFNLARNNLTGSSIEVDKSGDLLEGYTDNIQRANDIADTQKNNLEGADERTRSTLVNSVQSGLEQESALTSAGNNMLLNYNQANESNVAQNWDNMFDNWKAYNRNQRYQNAQTEDDDDRFGQTYFTNT